MAADEAAAGRKQTPTGWSIDGAHVDIDDQQLLVTLNFRGRGQTAYS
ncbi:hypothetical protein I546_0642 [Mycobacterium kansasii 732]|nr:hypothetical protein I546_0642 [Mycobacterium kansasii 732]